MIMDANENTCGEPQLVCENSEPITKVLGLSLCCCIIMSMKSKVLINALNFLQDVLSCTFKDKKQYNKEKWSLKEVSITKFSPKT